MKGLVKLTDYSITGGIFLLNLFLFATLVYQLGHDKPIDLVSFLATWQDWVNKAAGVAGSANQSPPVQSALSALVGALSVILIFCTGLMLDLLAPAFFTFFEMWQFRRWLASDDQRWMSRIIARNDELIGGDFSAFAAARPIRWLLDIRYFLAHRHHYLRLRSFIFSYIFVKASGAKLDELVDQIRIWEISRAIATAMLLQIFLNGWFAFSEVKVTGWALAVTGGQIAMFLVTVVIVLAAIARLRATLCSFLYLTGGDSQGRTG